MAPGFIDMHNHSDYTILAGAEGREHDPPGRHDDGARRVPLRRSGETGTRATARHAQGVNVDWTTLGGYFARLERQRMATNIASYVGEEQVWTYVKGYGQSAATPPNWR